MSILSWIEDPKRLKLLNAPKHVNAAGDSSKGLWTRCDKCGVILYIKHLKENQRVCFGCSYHLQMTSQERVENLLDKMSWRPLDETVSPCNPLGFHDQKDYTDRLQEAQERTGLQDAIQTGSGMIDGIPVALGVMDFDFMGGSMGSVVGEKVTRLIEYATQEGLTLILVCASGGARMQEGVFSLMQMAKISSALQVYQTCAKLLYISILTSPTTGGVTASFAMLGDIIFAEPKALIAFAGRRVIEQTLCEDLPDDFQTSEYMLHHGLLDLIVPRRFLRQALSESIRLYRNAPFKKTGRINFGVQNPISFLVEEKIRRQADKKWSTSSQNNFFNNNSQIDGLDQIEETSSISSKNRSNHKEHADPYNTSFKKEKVEIDSLSKNHADSVAGLPSTTRNAQGKETQFEEVFDIQTKNMLTKHKFAGVSLQTNETSNYREILTSFETMFHLFSKKLIVSYAQNTNSVSKENQEKTYLSQAKNIEGNGVKNTTSHNSSDLLLQDFMNFSKNQDDACIGLSQCKGLDQIESLEKDSKNPIYVDFLNKSIELAATESVEWRAFYVDQRIAPKACFLEDYVQSITAKTETLPVQQQKNDLTALQNILFYRSISRNLQ